jgi:hypothetical protein
MTDMLFPTATLTDQDAAIVGATIVEHLLIDETAADLARLVADNVAEYRWADDGDVELVARNPERGRDDFVVLAYCYTGADPDVDLTDTARYLMEVY